MFGQEQSESRYDLVAIDVFTKHFDVIPIKGKTTVETSNALDQVLIHLGHPASVLTDEGAEFKGSFDKRLKYYEISHITIRTPPHFR